MGKSLQSLFYLAWLCILASWPSSLKAVDCPLTATGLCTPGVEVVAVATGDDHSMAISDGGEVFTFGEGKLGQLGHGEVEVQLTPRAVGSALEELVTY